MATTPIGCNQNSGYPIFAITKSRFSGAGSERESAPLIIRGISELSERHQDRRTLGARRARQLHFFFQYQLIPPLRTYPGYVVRTVCLYQVDSARWNWYCNWCLSQSSQYGNRQHRVSVLGIILWVPYDYYKALRGSARARTDGIYLQTLIILNRLEWKRAAIAESWY